jgi:acetyltransferase-like isoleucine patch superfamily enzyme
MININTLPHFIRIFRQLYIKEKIDTLFSYIKAAYWHINIGKGCSFVGIVKFRKPPGSNIIIGNNVRMLSSFSSNLHGLNRKCMISTLNKVASINIGNDVGLSGAIIASANAVKIGDRVMVGANTTISDTDSHAINYQYRHPEFFGLASKKFVEPVKTKEIIIENDVFIGMHCLILKGAHIGKGSVIGAGSIVTGYIPSNVIAVGQPAKVIKKISLKE